jgi:3-hydroxy-9,10-secoandrosta-1,3,5(10)-triene-9,17-dione monooxygenase reductase component
MNATLDPSTFRAAMGHFLTGVTVVTSSSQNGMFGMTVNSLTSVSLEPCQILVCLKLSSATGQAIRESGRFAVNLLAHDQEHLARRFARPADDRFAEIDYELDSSGIPLLRGSLAHMVCDLDFVHPSGDHEIFIGNVRACQYTSTHPLAFFKGSMSQYVTG